VKLLRAGSLFAMLACAAGCARSVEVFSVEEAGGNPSPADAGIDASREPDASMGADASREPDAAPATGSARIVSAFEHTCVVDQSGLYCWGFNDEGQVGLGPQAPAIVAEPQRVEAAAEYREICAGEMHSCGLRQNGQLDCWGNNADGQLGLGDFERRASPTPLPDAPSFRSVACGGDISCALTESGALYCWGNNAEGALGQGEGSAVGRSSATPLLVPLAQPARQVSVGQGHVCAIGQDGELLCWGRGKNLQLGVAPPPGDQLRTPTPVAGGASYRHVGAGQEYTCAVRTDGRLACWGTNFEGRLGNGMSRGQVLEPTPVGEDADYLEVHATWFHSCALRAGGSLMCWGRNTEGQLGLGDTTLRTSPEPVVPAGEAWGAVAVGRFHTCALRGGAVYCWGENEDYQQLGLGDGMRRDAPTWVPIP
jgi:alpha-tubulin suppressor-like RCC1 family protein